MNFLVVDDNRLLTRFLGTYLRGKGHSAAEITNPRHVMDWLSCNPCDAISLDLGMPGIDGFTLLQSIREIYPIDKLVVVIFTGLGYDQDAIATSRRLGANGYVSKGLGPTEVFGVMMRCLENRGAWKVEIPVTES